MSILSQILADKRNEVDCARRRLPEEILRQRAEAAPAVRPFSAALRGGKRPTLIAEVKKASPSKGIIRHDFDPVAIARAYAANGAACLSVLTDEPFFQGHLDFLRAIRRAVPTPLLRKDFILDRYQLLEARLAGADAVLLIAEVLPDPDLGRLLAEARALGMEALVELHDAEQLPRVLGVGAELIGVNNRDLRTFVTRLEHTL